ncbi:MAG TPA: alpha/beta hydrolase [Acidimicrobiales bacterium]|nr:alpha/beta hydrolase [Acidimicrobiales bacterium]
MTRPTVMLRHNKVDLALHRLRDGAGGPLLLLHGLGERSPASVPLQAEGWPGPAWALDFTGHGGSTIPAGGGYTAEVLMGDVDAALEHLGPATIFGRGLGAYVALLISGARAEAVRGAVLADGPGLFGGPAGPTSPQMVAVPPGVTGPPDPFAMIELSRDVRPADYATTFARAAAEHSDLDQPIAVAAIGRPPWLEAVVDALVLEPTTVEDALAGYSR